ncbi:hypothetical protein FGO68_gene3543 [Halteria grandinella]|uniref:Uncharacterized protein n=1 Tax=Halteria grandinella TaxID=5974 RepID=A0A8J8NWZ7_HALGN|nr:hypothetical protein FGO68_gene3543 [Halteria grandinella]
MKFSSIPYYILGQMNFQNSCCPLQIRASFKLNDKLFEIRDILRVHSILAQRCLRTKSLNKSKFFIRYASFSP